MVQSLRHVYVTFYQGKLYTPADYIVTFIIKKLKQLLPA